MVEPLNAELARLRRLRDIVLATVQDKGLSAEAKVRTIGRAFQGERDEGAFPGESDEDDKAEEERDRERLS